MPIILAGGGFRHGQHLAFDPQNNTPLGNLYVSMLQTARRRDGPVLSDSTGTLRGSRTSGVTKPAGIDGHDGRR